MSKLTSTLRGSTSVTSAEFYSSDGVTPFVATGPAAFAVYDFNRNLVVSGVGVQSISQTQQWSATFTIPLTAPIPLMGEKYYITWVISNTNTNQTQTAIEYFFVKAEGDPISLESGRLVLPNGTFTDTLVVPTLITNINLRVLNENGMALLQSPVSTSTPNPRVINDSFLYDYTSPTPVLGLTTGLGIAPFFAEWSYLDGNGLPAVEIHPIYIISTKMYMFVDGVRRIVDKIRNLDVNPNLQYTELDLAHYVLEGIQRINAHAPTLTAYSPESMTPVLYPWVKKAGVVAALQAQYLAEGMTDIDFQGATVQLNMDRTQYIQTMLDQFNTDIDQNLQKTKKLITRSSGAGVLGISISSSTSIRTVSPFSSLFLLRQTFSLQ